jgi:hypothetical protein
VAAEDRPGADRGGRAGLTPTSAAAGRTAPARISR